MNPENLVLVLRQLIQDGKLSQRQLAECERLSLGTVNRAVNYAKDRAWLESGEEGLVLTEEGRTFLESYRVKNAIILAALPRSQRLPPMYDWPRGLTQVKGCPIIERQIEYLQEAGIRRISIMVGHMKETFDYLVDKYGVDLIYNPDYREKNPFSSLYHSLVLMDNTYVIGGEVWLDANVFETFEPISYLSVVFSEKMTESWCLEASPAGWVKDFYLGGAECFQFRGPAYFNRDVLPVYKELVREAYQDPRESPYFWQVILSENFRKLPIKLKDLTGLAYEFETVADLRTFDDSYWSDIRKEILALLPESYEAGPGDIRDLKMLSEGHDSLSYSFSLGGEALVFRKPGEWSRKRFDRAREKETYQVLAPLLVTDEVISLDVETGYRLTRYFEGARISDPFDDGDLKVAMEMIRRVHDRKIIVDYSFDIGGKIDFYEDMVRAFGALHFRDVREVRKKVDRLLEVIGRLEVPQVLCHGDYLFANILFLKNGGIRLIDWEYAGMGDPLMDVAMYGIFSFFDKDRLDLSLSFYLGRQAREEESFRLYLYAALAGYLWSFWGLLKQAYGIEMAEYPMRTYRYTKDFFKILESMDPSLAD